MIKDDRADYSPAKLDHDLTMSITTPERPGKDMEHDGVTPSWDVMLGHVVGKRVGLSPC